MEYSDVYDTLEQDVMQAYNDVLEYFDPREIAPNLNDIYLAYCCNIVDNIHDVYEEIFGEGSQIKDEWLHDLGVDRDGIPNVLQVCLVLNDFKLGYTFKGKLYNFMPQTLLVEEGIIEDVLP